MSLAQASRESPQDVIATTIFISNLHCPSCVEGIKTALSTLESKPESILVSIVSQSVVVRHTASLSVQDIITPLDATGFEVHSIFQNNTLVNSKGTKKEQGKDWHADLDHHATSKWLRPRGLSGSSEIAWRRKKHLENCGQCKKEVDDSMLRAQNSEKLLLDAEIAAFSPTHSLNDSKQLEQNLSVPTDFVAVGSVPPQATFRVTIAISGMTCSSCVSAITHAIQQLSWVQSIDVSLLTNSGVVVFRGKHNCEEIVETIEDCGFDTTVEKLEEYKIPGSKLSSAPETQPEKWRATYSVEGLTCASCIGNVTRSLEPYNWIDKVEVNLVTNIATVTFNGKEHLAEIQETIEDAGYGATLDNVIPEILSKTEDMERSVDIRIDGMFCHHCPGNIIQKLNQEFGTRCALKIEDPSLSLQSSILHIKYLPSSPQSTIRDILSTISYLNPVFKPSIYHPPTIEERAQEMHAQERRRLLFRLMLCVAMAIPTFILGVVFMSKFWHGKFT